MRIPLSSISTSDLEFCNDCPAANSPSASILFIVEVSLLDWFQPDELNETEVDVDFAKLKASVISQNNLEF